MKNKKSKNIFVQVLISVLVTALAFIAGVFIDGSIFTGTDGVKGHGMPIFTLVLPAIALTICIIRLIIIIIKNISRRNK